MLKLLEILRMSCIRFYSFELLKDVFGVPFLFVCHLSFFLFLVSVPCSLLSAIVIDFVTGENNE